LGGFEIGLLDLHFRFGNPPAVVSITSGGLHGATISREQHHKIL
jgi:hypothetical protein